MHLKPPKPFFRDLSLRPYSTFGIGGPARYLVDVAQVDELSQLLCYVHKEQIPFIVIGKGSNLLFDDRGFDGLVIVNKISFFEQREAIVSAGAGYSFALLGAKTARSGWAGLEFASGIPASVGGAIYMNAGASGQETKDALLDVTYVTESGEKKMYPRDQIQFSYRFSSFQTMKGVMAAARFQLTASPDAAQREKALIAYRLKTQPYKDRSAGCVFRNPTPDLSAGSLIDRCGLKGRSVGGAQVSSVHANFIVNQSGEASAQDVLDLVALVEQEVKEKTGRQLEREVRLIPYSIR